MPKLAEKIRRRSSLLDGFIAGPDGEIDDLAPADEESQFANEFFGSVDTIMFGRKDYEGFIAYWDTLDLTDESIPKNNIEFAKLFRKMSRVVISRTLETVGANTTLIKDNLAVEISRLKQQPGSYIMLVCGPDLLSMLAELGLVDEYLLSIMPKALGRGTTLFGNISKKLQLKLLTTKVFQSGVVMHHYQQADPGGKK